MICFACGYPESLAFPTLNTIFSLSLSLSIYIFSHCFKLCFILWSFLCKQFLETLSRPLTGSLRTAICQTIQSQNTMSTSSSRYATRALSFFELYILLFKWRNTLLRFSLCCFLVYDLLCWDKQIELAWNKTFQEKFIYEVDKDRSSLLY